MTLNYVKGVLVKDTTEEDKGRLGIVIDDRREKLLILLGDGLTIEDDRCHWEPVLYSPKFDIPANFVELLPVYEYAPDIRVSFQELKDQYDELEDLINEVQQEMRVRTLALAKRMEDLDGIKNATTEVLTRGPMKW